MNQPTGRLTITEGMDAIVELALLDADRQVNTLEAWLRAHPGVRVVCRDSSGAYTEAIRRALPEAVQAGPPSTPPSPSRSTEGVNTKTK